MAESTNFAKRFCEDTYSSREEVSSAYNLSNIDYIWEKVVEYRKNHTQTLEISSNDKNKFNLVNTNTIMTKIFRFETYLNKIFFDYNNLTSHGKQQFKVNRFIRILGNVAASSHIQVSDSILSTIIEGKVSTIPNEDLFISNYLNALNYLSTHDAGNITAETFNALFQILRDGSLNNETLFDDVKYRQTQLDTPHYYQPGYVYQAALVDRIPEMMEQLIDLANDSSLLAVTKSILTMFYIKYINPYELFGDYIATLAYKTSLAYSGYGVIAQFINIEGLMLFEDELAKKYLDLAQKTSDVTYFFNYALDYLLADEAEILDDIAEAVKQEVHYEDTHVQLSQLEVDSLKEKEEQINKDNQVNTFENTENGESEEINYEPTNKISNQQLYSSSLQVALPIFPKGFGEEDIERITTDLLETYPQLSKSQAHFYAGHCTLGRAYTIQQFKEVEKTSYETARTSMDHLVTLGLYERGKVKNKFIYRPVSHR